jgi:hypothetical protein
MAAAGAVAAVLLPLGLLVTQTAGASTAGARAARSATPTAAQIAAAARRPTASGPGPFHQTRTVERVNLINGQNVVVDKRTVSLKVNITNNLIDRQIVHVSWTGAHPTGGIESDPNDPGTAPNQEYPMVLLECHGTPKSKAPLARQIQPQDCWTSTPSERFFSTSPDAPFPPWRLDRYATAADQRNLTVNQPDPEPADCFLLPGPHFWLPYVTPTGKSYPVGPAGCAGMPDEMSFTGGLGILPSNETFAASNINGRGSAAFDIWTDQLNVDLGCSQTVPCALVAVPVMGISCDPAGTGMPAADQPQPGDQEQQAAAQCEQTGFFAPGSRAATGELNDYDLSVSGQLWWAASNWRNRFVVPLHFAPPTNVCTIVSKGGKFIQIYGSELMDQAALQWQPHFCLNKKLFTLSYVEDPEPEAATELQAGTVQAALVSDQPSGGFPKPVVHAPVAATGFAISFTIDNSAGVPVTSLNLDPRLLAKLLTESYPGEQDIAYSDPELLHACPGVPVPNSNDCTNPLDLTQDPEFQALNPDVPRSVGESAAASVLLALSTNSDVMYALTSYINANPAARAWLNGTPDPWGMTVNTAYKGIKLPLSNWPLLSTFEPKDWVSGLGGPGPCYVRDPSPALPLLAAPVPDLPTIAEDVQFYVEQVQLGCAGNPSDPAGEHEEAAGPQIVGFRFMIGITTLADARRFALHTASLLTYTKPGTPAKFTSAKGMTFVAPTDASMRAAAALYAPDKSGHDWTFPYSLYLHDRAKAAGAYPGTMLVYADVPVTGLSSAVGKDYSEFVHFVSTRGQTPGGGVGQLAPGYLPMTTANHLGPEANYALAAAAAIGSQSGAIPALLAKYHPPAGSSPTSSPSTGTGTGTGSGTGSNSGTGGGSPTSSPSPGAGGSQSPPAKVALTPEANFGLAGYVLPGVAGLALVAAIGAVLTPRLARVRRKKWQ